MNMPHLIVLHSGSNEFYINAEHISAIFPTIVKRDQRELHGSKLLTYRLRNMRNLLYKVIW